MNDDPGAMHPRAPRRREWLLRGMLLVLLVSLVASLGYEGDPPPDVVHTHHAFRLYADGAAVEFPLFNYKVRHVDVHIEEDPDAGLRANELVHVHRAGVTLGDYLRSLGLDLAAGRLCLDDEARIPWAIHRGECWGDNATHEWRLYGQHGAAPWGRLASGPANAADHVFGTGERLLLTYAPRAWSDDAPGLRAQQDAVLAGVERWPQATGGNSA